MEERVKVVVLGIDGGSWNLIKEHVESGVLKNFKKLVDNGVHGYLKSSIPPSTLPAWKCYSTGLKPRNISAFYWYMFDAARKKVRIAGAELQKHKEIWDYLGERGLVSVVLNMPTLYPPKKINGAIVSGFPAQDSKEYTYPKQLKRELVEKLQYRINPSGTLRVNIRKREELERKYRVVKEIYELIKLRFEAAKYLWEKYRPDFMHLTVFYTDSLHHYMLNNEQEMEMLAEAWKILDEKLGEFLEFLGEEKLLFFVMSDHGMEKLRATFYVNNYLHEKGYLKLKKSGLPARLLGKLGLSLGLVYRLAKKKPFSLLVKLAPPSAIVRAWFFLRRSPKETSLVELVDSVDWQRTKAVAIGDYAIYVNAPWGSEEHERIRSELIEELKSVKDPEHGESPFKKLYRGEELYDEDDCRRWGLSIVFQWRDGYLVQPAFHVEGRVWSYESEDGYSGFHAENGMFVAYGFNVKKGARIDAEIYDLAPTVLYAMGLEDVAEKLDGKVLREIFLDPEAFKGGRVRRTVESEKERIRRRVKMLRLNRVERN